MKRKSLLNKVGNTFLAGTFVLSNLLNSGCSREYLKNTQPVKPTTYKENHRYKSEDLVFQDGTRYYLKHDGETFKGINKENTMLVEDTKTVLWDEEDAFYFSPARGEKGIKVTNFTERGRLRNKKTENSYKYSLNHLNTIKIGEKTFRTIKRNGYLIMFDESKTNTVLNEEDNGVYFQNREGQNGIWIAELKDNENKNTQEQINIDNLNLNSSNSYFPNQEEIKRINNQQNKKKKNSSRLERETRNANTTTTTTTTTTQMQLRIEYQSNTGGNWGGWNSNRTSTKKSKNQTPRVEITSGDNIYRTINKGETSWEIAREYNSNLKTFQRLNPDVDLENIKPGQVIRVK